MTSPLVSRTTRILVPTTNPVKQALLLRSHRPSQLPTLSSKFHFCRELQSASSSSLSYPHLIQRQLAGFKVKGQDQHEQQEHGQLLQMFDDSSSHQWQTTTTSSSVSSSWDHAVAVNDVSMMERSHEAEDTSSLPPKSPPPPLQDPFTRLMLYKMKKRKDRKQRSTSSYLQKVKETTTMPAGDDVIL